MAEELRFETRRYIDASGNVETDLPLFAQNRDVLKELYRLMVLIRTFDKKVVSLQRTGKMGTFASSLGQEGVAVGTGHAMQQEDILVPYYRDQGILYQRRVKLLEIMQYWGGDERGSRFIYNREDLPISIPIATQFVHAVGVAYAVKLRHENRAVLTTCGDGGTSEGDFYTALNGAGTWDLPLVFIVINNQWAISVPRKIQSRTKTLAQKAVAAGIEGYQIDGNDVIAVKQAVEEALEKARSGGGPTLIEALTYRLADHTTADDATRYISKKELDTAWTLEPVRRLRSYLTTKQLLTSEEDKTIASSCRQEVEDAVEEYLSLSPQPPDSIFDYQYGNMPAVLQEQRHEVMSNLQSE